MWIAVYGLLHFIALIVYSYIFTDTILHVCSELPYKVTDSNNYSTSSYIFAKSINSMANVTIYYVVDKQSINYAIPLMLTHLLEEKRFICYFPNETEWNELIYFLEDFLFLDLIVRATPMTFTGAYRQVRLMWQMLRWNNVLYKSTAQWEHDVSYADRQILSITADILRLFCCCFEQPNAFLYAVLLNIVTHSLYTKPCCHRPLLCNKTLSKSEWLL